MNGEAWLKELRWVKLGAHSFSWLQGQLELDGWRVRCMIVHHQDGNKNIEERGDARVVRGRRGLIPCDEAWEVKGRNGSRADLLCTRQNGQLLVAMDPKTLEDGDDEMAETLARIAGQAGSVGNCGDKPIT